MNKNTLFTIAKYLLALIFVVFGANKLFGFMEMPLPPDPTAQTFMTGIFSSYLGKFIGICEILGGIMLVLPKTSWIGMLILAPILINIALFHIFHDFPGNPVWIVTFLLGLVAAYSHRDRIKA